MELIHEKNEGQQSRDTVPLSEKLLTLCLKGRVLTTLIVSFALFVTQCCPGQQPVTLSSIQKTYLIRFVCE